MKFDTDKISALSMIALDTSEKEEFKEEMEIMIEFIEKGLKNNE